MNDFNIKIHDYIESHEEEIINTLSSLIEIPSVKGEAKENMPFGEYPYKALIKMLDICKSNGFYTKNIDNYVGQADFYEGIEPEVGILCHLDVVPAGDGWNSDPFKMELKDGILIGRGVADDKGPGVIVLYAMKALKDLGYKLSKNVRFIFGTDEEKGSSDIRYYEKKEKLPNLVFTADAEYPLINLEKGMVRGEVSFTEEKTGGKKSIIKANGGFVTNAVPARANATLSGFTREEVEIAFIASGLNNISYTFEENVLYVEGKSAHASTPKEGVNAVTALNKILSNLPTDDNTNLIFKKASNLFVFGETNGKSLGIDFKDEKSGELTFVFSIMNYEHGKFSGNFDIRFPICTNVNEVRSTLEKAILKEGFVLSSLSGVEPHYVDENSDFVKTLLSVYEEHTGLKGEAIAIGGGTYVHEIENGVAFGCAFIGEDNHMHGADECVSLENVKKNIAIFASAIYKLCK